MLLLKMLVSEGVALDDDDDDDGDEDDENVEVDTVDCSL